MIHFTCRYYDRYWSTEHTLIIKKKTAIIDDYIYALITDVEDDVLDKIIFITNVAVICYVLDRFDLIKKYMKEPIPSIKLMIKNNLNNLHMFKYVKINKYLNTTEEWFVELTPERIEEMVMDVCTYFIEYENEGTLTIDRFRKELIDSHPALRYYYDRRRLFLRVDYINEENKKKEINLRFKDISIE